MNPLRVRSMKARFASASILLVVCSMLLLSFVINQVASKHAKEDVGRYLASTAYHIADMLDRDMWARYKEIEVLSKLDIFTSKADNGHIQVFLDQLQRSIPLFTWIGFTDATGHVLASTNRILLGKSIAQRPVFLEALKGPFIGDVHEAVLLASLLPNPTGEQMKFVDVSCPVYDEANNLVGVLAAHLSWSWVSEIDETYLKPTFEKLQVDLLIVAADGTVLLGPKDVWGKSITLPESSRTQDPTPSWFVQTWQDGETYVVGAAFGDGHLSSRGLGWTVMARQKLDDAYAGVHVLQKLIVGLGVVLSALFAVVGAYVAGKITRPLKEIAGCAQQLRDGQQVNFPVHSDIAEINILSASLREMVDSLKQTRNERDDMQELANVDLLTQLPNRVRLESYLDAIASQTVRHNHVVAVLYLDLDGFKHINDTLGHDAGDFVLQTVAIRIKGCLRGDDKAARLGGDEFVVLADADKANARAEIEVLGKRIINSINNHMYLGDNELHVGCSVGVSFYPVDSDDLRHTLKNADDALYKAKQSGKNRVVFY